MKYLLPITMLTFCSNLLSAQTSENLQVHELTLKNGMTVWLNEDHSQPKVFGAVVVKAGAKDSPNTGIPHYFEHIMFKGTDKIGTIDYSKEKILLDRISEKYDELAATTNNEARSRIQSEINELSIQAAEYVIPNEFDQLITEYGGTKLNAGTSYDYTVYFNTFSPQYMHQWAEINSERLLHPVFRMFQSELETVYEEKNMYSDFIGGQAVEKLTERYFRPHPYSWPILGSTENLKNPRLTEMQKFFEEYYVASNMGLILSGDFDAETIRPLLESTFGRIQKGSRPEKNRVELPPFKGKEKVQIKLPIPFVKVLVLGFRGLPANHKDEVAMKIAIALLNNSNGTGYLDKLIVDHKVMAAMGLSESLNEAGMLGVVVVPKLLVQSYGSAEKLAWEAINKVKRGDFSEATFQSLKLEQKREYATELEDIQSRAQKMMRLYSQGKRWDDYLEEVAQIDALTKEDVMEAANTYFSDNYLQATKKTGKYPKDNLPKPNYRPIIPGNRDARSEFARRLEQLPVRDVTPRFIDFEKDVEMLELKPLIHLYKTTNQVNDIFTLKLSFGIGQLERPILTQLASYLNFIGTESMSFDAFRNGLQVLGSTLSFEVSDTDFNIYVKGVEDHIEETLELVGLFMREAKADDKKIKQLVGEQKVMEKAFVKSSDNMAAALLEKVKYGAQSRYLNKLSLSEIKKLKGKTLTTAFVDLQQVECNIHYCGNTSMEDMSAYLNRYISFTGDQISTHSPFYNEKETYEKPVVYFYDMPGVSQSIVYGYIKGTPIVEDEMKYASKLYAYYLGGDMSSIMFQEIREFRSFAYRVSARHNYPIPKHANKPGDLITLLSTQSDKTTDAIAVLDSILQHLPERPEKVEAIRQSIANHINNEYPSFRDISIKISSYRRDGYESDPNISFLQDVTKMDMETILRFHKSQVKGRPVVYAIVGNSKKINMKQLAEFGKIVKVKKKDIYK